jgi:hypothetical protein
MINQTKSRGCFQCTLEYSNMVSSVVSFRLTILGLRADLSESVFSNLHGHAESHLESTLTHIFSLFIDLLLQVLCVQEECLRVFLHFFVCVLFQLLLVLLFEVVRL